MKSPGLSASTPTHDDLIKKLLHQPRLLRDFFRAFVPEVMRFADLEQVEYLDKEHPRTGRSPRRTGDVLVKTRWRDKDAGFLLHIESQNRAQEVLLERAVEYAMRDSIRYRLPVMPVVLLTYPRPEQPVSNRLRWDFGRAAAIHAHCPVLHFRCMDPEPHLHSRNVAALALSALMHLSGDQQVEAIVQTIAEALRQRFDQSAAEAALDFVQYYSELREEQLLQLQYRVTKLARKETILTPMTKLLNPFVELGKLKGRVEGRVDGQLAMALNLVTRKYPRLAKSAGAALPQWNEEQLLTFAEALLFMDSEKDCAAWLRRRGR